MNPQPASVSPKPMQDIKPPAPAKTAPGADTGLVQAEIEHSIPVKQPDQPSSGAPASGSSNPVVGTQFVQEDYQSDAELEGVLKDVNQKVKEEDKKPKAKRNFFHIKKTKPVKPGAKPVKVEAKHSKPVLVAAAACVVAGALAVAALYAFKQTDSNQAPVVPSTVGTSSSSSTQPVQPQDLGNLYSDLQSKLNSLNDTQDFNQADLSDQNLGL